MAVADMYSSSTSWIIRRRTTNRAVGDPQAVESDGPRGDKDRPTGTFAVQSGLAGMVGTDGDFLADAEHVVANPRVDTVREH